MKNLKKVLALVLAFACAFTMFAGAAFTDAADIEQTEAVEMLSALGVINGYTDGSFKPNDTISRAEAAKMIYTIWNGGNDNASAFEGKSVFTDVYSGHWAEGYINFCYTNGIINGKGNSKFAPDDKVTGTELAKMLLICMGYQADKSGLTGTGYTQRTNALATQNGLYVDVTSSVTAAMPRQYAAQIMYNALKADTVKWSTDIGDYQKVRVTGWEWRTDKNGNQVLVPVETNETMGSKCMSLTTAKGLMLKKVEKEAGRDTYSLNNGDYTRVAVDYSDLIGQRVNVLYKQNETDKVYGVYAHEDSKVVATGFLGQLETVTGGEKVKLNGTEYKVEDVDGDLNNAYKLVYSVNKDTTASKNLAELAMDDTNAPAKRSRDAAASELKLIDNDGDGKVDTATYTPVKIGQVAAVTKTSITVNGVGTFKFADDTIYDGVAKNDYVRVIADTNVSEGGNHVEKLDVVNAKAEGTRTGEVKIDGTWYKLAHENGNYVSVTTNTTYDFTIVGNTVLYADEAEGSVSKVGFISAVKEGDADKILGTSEYKRDARMYFADGTDATITVSRVAGDKITDKDDGYTTNAWAGKMYTYTKLADGTYDIKEVGDANLAGTDAFIAEGDKADVGDASNKNGAYYDSKIYGVSLADDAVVFVKTGKETKVLTGAQVKSWSKTLDAQDLSGDELDFSADMLIKESNGIDYVKAATLVTTVELSVPGAKDTSYAYAVTDEYETTLDGETKWAVDAWNGTETVTLYTDTTDFTKADGSAVDLKAGDLFSYKVNGKFIEQVSKAYHEASVLGFDGKAEGELKVQDKNVAQVNTYTLAEDCVILTVDDAKNAGVAGAELGSIVEAGTKTVNNVTTRVPNVMYLFGSDDNANKIVAIVIDSENNELD